MPNPSLQCVWESDSVVFSRVRESQVLFLAGKTKGCFYAPPYLDDYGETDQGLRWEIKPGTQHALWIWCVKHSFYDPFSFLHRRGNPLHLCRERYRKIQKLWRQHSITEEIGHAQEANQTLVGIDWQHLWYHFLIKGPGVSWRNAKSKLTRDLHIYSRGFHVNAASCTLLSFFTFFPPSLPPFEWVNECMAFFFSSSFWEAAFPLTLRDLKIKVKYKHIAKVFNCEMMLYPVA